MTKNGQKLIFSCEEFLEAKPKKIYSEHEFRSDKNYVVEKNLIRLVLIPISGH